jgi:hypothetical protein
VCPAASGERNGEGHRRRCRRDGHRGSAVGGLRDGRGKTNGTAVDLVRIQPASDGGLRASGSERHIDLLHVDWPARDEIEIAQKWSDSVPAQLDLAPKPAGGDEILDSGQYEVSVEIRARNADAIHYVIPVYWDGKWSGKAAMWDHLRLELPRKVR